MSNDRSLFADFIKNERFIKAYKTGLASRQALHHRKQRFFKGLSRQACQPVVVKNCPSNARSALDFAASDRQPPHVAFCSKNFRIFLKKFMNKFQMERER